MTLSCLKESCNLTIYFVDSMSASEVEFHNVRRYNMEISCLAKKLSCNFVYKARVVKLKYHLKLKQ